MKTTQFTVAAAQFAVRPTPTENAAAVCGTRRPGMASGCDAILYLNVPPDGI